MMKKIIYSSVIVSTIGFGAAYKVPEQSINSMALGAAYVAHTSGADSAYYNPAAMSFMDDKNYLEGSLTLAHLPSIKYDLVSPYSGKTKVENIVIPNLHYVSKAYGDIRWGISVATPAGLSKRWDTPYQKLYAQEFTLRNVEINPSVSYRVSDSFSIAGGLRVIYSEGKVYSDGSDAGYPIKRQMEGDTIEFGYNLALLYKAPQDINLAVTYRSNVDLDEEGDANLYLGGIGSQYSADVTVPIPAALNIAISKTWNDTFTLEFVYERTFWSEYKTLDFNYNPAITNPILKDAFDTPIDKSWKDTDTFRIGATYVMDRLTLMCGFAIDETPIPDKTIAFELPDSDAKIYSIGFRYQQSENLSWGMAILYDDKESRTIPAGVTDNDVLKNGGIFSDGGAILTTIGVSYEF
jgi:long-chain fatty acid transport protein